MPVIAAVIRPVIAHSVARSVATMRDANLLHEHGFDTRLHVGAGRTVRVAVAAHDRAQCLGRAVEVVADPSIGRGGCLIQNDATQVDARIETGLARARTVLLGDDTPGTDLA